MHKDILKKLYETFVLSSRKGTGGMTFKYVPNEDVINRMNKVFNGNWSTSVKFKDVIDDQVILEVEVSVTDPKTEVCYSHTGFGSQQIMRYNSGPNQGKIIDIGNGYKGALAKAIVNACTRWGVGLYKESNPTAVPAAAPAVMPPVPNTTIAPPVAAPIMTVVPPVAAPITTATPPPVVAPPTTAAPAIPLPPTTASPTPSPYTIETTAPPTTVEAPPVVVETMTTFPPPMSPDQPVSANISVKQELPKIPTPTTTAPTLPLSPDEGLSGIGISDVQRVALNGILTMNNAQYDELALEAFQANGINKTVPNKEDLNYDEAVVVIKFGNDKYRKNR